MSDATAAEHHLRALHAILLQEARPDLARGVEGVLAELLDDAATAAVHRERAAIAWAALFVPARGLHDFGIWRDGDEERLRSNAVLGHHFDALGRLLR